MSEKMFRNGIIEGCSLNLWLVIFAGIFERQ